MEQIIAVYCCLTVSLVFLKLNFERTSEQKCEEKITANEKNANVTKKGNDNGKQSFFTGTPVKMNTGCKHMLICAQ